MQQFYLSRQGKNYGPYTEAHMRQMATAGQLVPHDLVALAGATSWQKAADVPGLFAARRTPPPIPPIPVGSSTLPPSGRPTIPPIPVRQPSAHRMACFGCFVEVTVTVPTGAHEAPCPQCGTLLQVADAATLDGRPAEAAAFAGIGDDLNDRIDRTLANGRAEANAAGAAMLGVRILGAVLNA